MSLLFPQYVFAPSRGGACGSRFSSSPRCGGGSRWAPAQRRPDATIFWDFLDDTVNEFQRAAASQSKQPRKRTFNPRFDVQESGDAYHLEGEVPGVEQKDLSIEFVDEKTLKISGSTESVNRNESGPSSSEKLPEYTPREETAATDAEEATPASETGSTRTLQATVEDGAAENEWVDVPGSEKRSVAAEKQPLLEEQQQIAEQPQQEQQAAPKEAQQPQTQSWLSERRYGEFSRSFRFASRVDREAVRASLKNGLLQVVIPKAPAPEVRRINID